MLSIKLSIVGLLAINFIRLCHKVLKKFVFTVHLSEKNEAVIYELRDIPFQVVVFNCKVPSYLSHLKYRNTMTLTPVLCSRTHTHTDPHIRTQASILTIAFLKVQSSSIFYLHKQFFSMRDYDVIVCVCLLFTVTAKMIHTYPSFTQCLLTIQKWT